MSLLPSVHSLSLAGENETMETNETIETIYFLPLVSEAYNRKSGLKRRKRQKVWSFSTLFGKANAPLGAVKNAKPRAKAPGRVINAHLDHYQTPAKTPWVVR